MQKRVFHLVQVRAMLLKLSGSVVLPPPWPAPYLSQQGGWSGRPTRHSTWAGWWQEVRGRRVVSLVHNGVPVLPPLLPSPLWMRIGQAGCAISLLPTRTLTRLRMPVGRGGGMAVCFLFILWSWQGSLFLWRSLQSGQQCAGMTLSVVVLQDPKQHTMWLSSIWQWGHWCRCTVSLCTA